LYFGQYSYILASVSNHVSDCLYFSFRLYLVYSQKVDFSCVDSLFQELFLFWADDLMLLFLVDPIRVSEHISLVVADVVREADGLLEFDDAFIVRFADNHLFFLRVISDLVQVLVGLDYVLVNHCLYVLWVWQR
jgi:hypothetical protein